MCLAFEDGLKRGSAPPIDSYIKEAGEPVRSELLRQLLLLELDYRQRRGEVPDLQEYGRLYPHDTSVIEQAFRASGPDAAADSAGPDPSGGPDSTGSLLTPEGSSVR